MSARMRVAAAAATSVLLAASTLTASVSHAAPSSIDPALIRALVTTCTTEAQNFGPFQCAPGASGRFRVPEL